ncbi:unannotated protein [freshwater metagenome]|uniref:Unannotated protein n=1 Tax=freshwater metagenome TaxID=449393 RepID=A0A6J7R2W7_9ZZZZ
MPLPTADTTGRTPLVVAVRTVDQPCDDLRSTVTVQPAPRIEIGATEVTSRLLPLTSTVGAGVYRSAPETVDWNPFCAGTTTRYVPAPTANSASSSVPMVR